MARYLRCMRQRQQRWSALTAAALAISVVSIGACGSGDEKSEAEVKPASSPQQFADRFASISGLRLEPVSDPFGTSLEVPDVPDRSVRYGVYSLTWTRDDDIRETMLGRGVKADADGIYWSKSTDRWHAAKPFGPRLVLDWLGERTKRRTPDWGRIERAVRAAYLGDTSVLEPAEQPCAERGLDPLRGKPGECSVEGIPVTFAAAGKPLATPALEVEVLGVDTTDEVGPDTIPQKAKGRFVQVAYRARNTSDRPITFLQMAARLDGETVQEDLETGPLLSRSRSFPIAPGEDVEASAVFDVDPAVAGQARAKGALVFASGFDDAGSLSPELTQGWVRLAGAPRRLPEPPEAELPPGAPEHQPEPTGPPDIEVDLGSGKPIGGAARCSPSTPTSRHPMTSSGVACAWARAPAAVRCRRPPPGSRPGYSPRSAVTPRGEALARRWKRFCSPTAAGRAPGRSPHGASAARGASLSREGSRQPPSGQLSGARRVEGVSAGGLVKKRRSNRV